MTIIITGKFPWMYIEKKMDIPVYGMAFIEFPKFTPGAEIVYKTPREYESNNYNGWEILRPPYDELVQ